MPGAVVEVPVRRLVPKNPLQVVKGQQGCVYCGTIWGTAIPFGSTKKEALDFLPTQPSCPTTTCPICYSVVCASYAMARGTCPVCLVGILIGSLFSLGTCERKGCFAPRIAVYRRRCVCKSHFPDTVKGMSLSLFLSKRLDLWKEL